MYHIYYYIDFLINEGCEMQGERLDIILQIAKSVKFQL